MSEPHSLLTSVNGEFDDQVSVFDRGFSFGDGVFETLRWQQSSLPLLNLHLERLELGCQRLSIPISMTRLNGELLAFLTQLSGLTDSAVVKIQVTRGESSRGYSIDPEAFPTIVLSAFPSSDFDKEREQGIALGLCRQPISSGLMLAGIKHLNRLENVLLKQEAHEQGYKDALVCDSDGHVIETTSANIFMVCDGIIKTPSLQRAGVSGVIRRLIIDEIAHKLDVSVEEAVCSLSDVCSAEAVFISNSLMGVVPITHVDLDGQIFEYKASSTVASIQNLVEQTIADRCISDGVEAEA